MTGALAIVAGVCGFVWGPLWWHHHLPDGAPTAAVIQAHRQSPPDATLDIVVEASMMTDHPLRGAEVTAVARRILDGELAWPKMPVVPVTPDFAAADLQRGPPVLQLFASSLIVPDVLLRAYEHTGEAAFLAAATRYVDGFIAFERRQLFPVSWLRNSHAVANRVAVLSRYWRAVRHQPTFDDTRAAALHAHLLRLAALLSDPRHFVGGTNHGVMQNIALLQLAVGYPKLQAADEYRALALSRLREQLPFWIGSDGAVLEHSAGYHFHGVVLTGYIVRLLEAGGGSAPPEFTVAHERTLRFLSQIQRPDRSLPLIGNTYRYHWRLPPLLGVDDAQWQRRLDEPAAASLLLPLSGHAIWRHAGNAGGAPLPSQAIVQWGWFPAHGHRRDQEMSLHLWAGGFDWSTNTGYWPGDDEAGETASSGWDGGNGPHLLGEPSAPNRRTDVLGHAEADDLRFIDLRRQVAGGPSLRRQIVQIGGDRWLVVDTFDDPQGRTLRVLWTGVPETRASSTGDGRFEWRRDDGPVAMTLNVTGSPGVTARPISGSRTPFGGWLAFDRRVTPAPAVDARLPAGRGWMLSALQLAPPGAPPTPLRATLAGGADEWRVDFGADGQAGSLQRRGDMLLLTSASGRTPTELRIVAASDTSAERQRIDAARQAVAERYPRFRDLIPERRKVTLALAALGVGALLLLAVGWWRWPRARRWIWLGTVAPCLAIAGYAGLFYLHT